MSLLGAMIEYGNDKKELNHRAHRTHRGEEKVGFRF
jgi:hypothetical protein